MRPWLLTKRAMLVNNVQNIQIMGTAAATRSTSREEKQELSVVEAAASGTFVLLLRQFFSCCSSRNVPGLQHIQRPEGNVSFYNVTARNVTASSVLQHRSDKSVWMSSWMYEGSERLVLRRKKVSFFFHQTMAESSILLPSLFEYENLACSSNRPSDPETCSYGATSGCQSLVRKLAQTMKDQRCVCET